MNPPLIQVQDLEKSFPIERRVLPVLKGLDLSIARGEMVAVVGASGVGKSTLLHILGALDHPTSGKILFDGVDIFSLSDRQLAQFRNRRIGFVFQFHHLLPEFTALENVMMPGRIARLPFSETQERAKDLLESVGLSERLAHRPGELSGGEQQRVAVARALLMRPDVILADEPTGNLDTKTSDEVFQLLRELNKRDGITFVVVTHNERLSGLADRVVRMVDGQVNSEVGLEA